MVSIILPTYNRRDFLMESIQSVLEQTVKDFELIVMDDGSNDGTGDLVRNFGDARIKYHWVEHTGHTGYLKNIAIREAKGEFFAFIDSDDKWKPQKLELQLQVFSENPTIGFCITDVTTFRDDQILMRQSYHKNNTIEIRNVFQWLVESRFIIYNPTLILRRSCLELTGAFSEEFVSGDYNFNLRLAHHFYAAIIYEPLVWRRIHETNWSEQSTFENYHEYVGTFEFLYKKGLIGRKYLNKAISNAFFKTGNLYASRGDIVKARKHYLSSLKHKAFQPKCYWKLLGTYIHVPAL